MWLARRQRAAAILHTVLHLAVVVGVVDLLLQLSGVAAGDPWMRAVLGGALGGGTATQMPAPQQTQQGQQSGGSILDVLGGLLGGGRR